MLLMLYLLFAMLLNFYLTLSQSIPSTPCPNVFQYQRDNGNGPIYGRIVAPNDYSGTYNLQVNVSYAALLNQNIQLQLLTKGNDAVNGSPLIYNVIFPVQNIVPKVTQILINGRVICSGPPEQLLPGRGISNLWAQHELRTSVKQVPVNGDRRPPNFDYEAPNLVTPYNNNNAPDDNREIEVIYHNYADNPFLKPTVSTPRTTTTPFLIPRQETRPATATTTATTTTTTPKPSPITQLFTSPPGRQSTNDYDECGIAGSQPLVFGGTDVKPGEFPWLVAIITLKSKTNYEYICTGNLISTRHVLTAAHCVVNQPRENIFCVLGTHNISNWLLNEHVLRSLRLVNVHFEYRPQNISSDADVALLTMNADVEYQRNIRPICLWKDVKNNDIDDLIDQTGLVAGWGKSSSDNDFNEVPRRITLPIVRSSDCYSSAFNFFSILSNRTFCAGKRDNTGPCTGDSGAGFLLKINNRWTLRGLASRALPNEDKSCNLRHYVVFADVAKVMDWLNFVLTL